MKTFKRILQLITPALLVLFFYFLYKISGFEIMTITAFGTIVGSLFLIAYDIREISSKIK
jgi:hypothetical protein